MEMKVSIIDELCLDVLMWTKPDVINDEIGAKEQLKQELVINYQNIPFNIISMNVSFTMYMISVTVDNQENRLKW